MKLTGKNAYSDDLNTTDWLGQVVDIEDPLKIGRVKIRVWGKFDELDTKFIPWAMPLNNIVAGSESGGSFFSVPKLNSIVGVTFDNDDIYHPQYSYNQRLSDEVRDEIKDSYTNAHVIVYDTVTKGSLKIFFTEEKGLMLSYKDNIINIKNDDSINIGSKSDINITVEGNANIKASKVVVESSNIDLGGGAEEQLILGNSFERYFNAHTHLTPVGPSLPPTLPMLPNTKSSNTKTL